MKTNISIGKKIMISSLFDTPKTNNNMGVKYVDLFAGIGGFRLVLDNLGFQCVFSNDFDKDACITYSVNFGEILCQDIHQVNTKDIPDFDILCAGFPCQPFSIAGYRQGFNDTKGRGNVFFDIIRILKDKKPKAILLENVKNLKTHDNKNTIKVIYEELEALGYKVTDKVLNSMEYGDIPQNRERIYIVGFLEQKHFDNFKFPDKIVLKRTIHECLEEKVDKKYYYNNKPLYNRIKKDIVDKNTIYQWRRKYVRGNKSNVCPTLTANMGMGGHNVPIILDSKGIRKLTPRECANFQGFPKDYKLPNIADSSLYKQFGNSVCIPVVKRVVKNIKKAYEIL